MQVPEYFEESFNQPISVTKMNYLMLFTIENSGILNGKSLFTQGVKFF